MDNNDQGLRFMGLATKTGEVKFRPAGVRVLPYPAGEYSASVKYTATDTTAPYVLLSGTYYVMNKIGSWLGTSTGKTPAQDYAANGKNATWIPFENYKAIFVEMLIANFGKLASAVFYGEYMFSQQGVDANGNATNDYSKFGTNAFEPNLMLDFLHGKIKGRVVEVEGSIITPYSRITLEPNVPLVYAVSGRVNAYIDCLGDGIDNHTLFMPSAQEMRAGTEVNLFYFVRPGRVAPKPYIKIYPGNEGFLPDNVTQVFIGESKELQLKVVRIGPNETDKRWFVVNA